MRRTSRPERQVIGTCNACELQLIEGWDACPDCGADLTQPEAIRRQPATWERARVVGNCARCGLQVVEGWATCPDCSLDLRQMGAVEVESPAAPLRSQASSPSRESSSASAAEGETKRAVPIWVKVYLVIWALAVLGNAAQGRQISELGGLIPVLFETGGWILLVYAIVVYLAKRKRSG